jgi:diadenosine tetraphosphate (Ap4A) HIT family hydrolase
MPDSTRFNLNSRLAADTIEVGDLPLCRVLLMNDARFPWLILVPRVNGLQAIDQLDHTQGMQLLDEIARCSDVLRHGGHVDRINVASLGNIVSQLHVHVVARRTDDDAWPGPVWGHGKPVPHDSRQADERIRDLRERLPVLTERRDTA